LNGTSRVVPAEPEPVLAQLGRWSLRILPASLARQQAQRTNKKTC